MHELTIMIVDDEPAAGNILKLLIEKHIAADKVIHYFENPEDALIALEIVRPSLLMLDIEMPNMNGFDFLNKSAYYDFDVIFTTAYDKYAIKAIRFSALDYLLKPVDSLELQNAINRHIVKRKVFDKKEQTQLVGNLIQNLKQKSFDDFKLAVSVKEGVFLLELKDIVCLEGQNNYTKFYFTKEKPILVAKTLKEYEDILSEHDFIRVHKSFMANKIHVKKLDSESMLWLTNDVVIPVSRRKKNELIAFFSNH